ncbi:hypothetical protein GCM10008027_36850 [Pseudoalteromonas gelatinilytica]|uniref:Uncharacterized protein n=1 Tax=Pseudoalteromonas gelatinilytica TaxID=1703256 RepID=A0ABQ1U243_9GAMM|nr:hypothetical protein GCM10008027_36850 [Pseudoalteromonas profundi]
MYVSRALSKPQVMAMSSVISLNINAHFNTLGLTTLTKIALYAKVIKNIRYTD